MEKRVLRSSQSDEEDFDEVDPVMVKFSKKFSLPSKPGSDLPELPRYLDDLSDEDLMGLYTEFIAWVSYAKADMVQAEIAEERSANDCRLIESRVLIEQWGSELKGDRVTIAKARRDTDARVSTAQRKHQQSRAYRKLVESVFDRCERGAQLLSRELSRRIASSPRDNRAGRFSA